MTGRAGGSGPEAGAGPGAEGEAGAAEDWEEAGAEGLAARGAHALALAGLADTGAGAEEGASMWEESTGGTAEAEASPAAASPAAASETLGLSVTAVVEGMGKV